MRWPLPMHRNQTTIGTAPVCLAPPPNTCADFLTTYIKPFKAPEITQTQRNTAGTRGTKGMINLDDPSEHGPSTAAGPSPRLEPSALPADPPHNRDSPTLSAPRHLLSAGITAAHRPAAPSENPTKPPTHALERAIVHPHRSALREEKHACAC